MYPYFVGFDVHKQVIAYCSKTAEGRIVIEGTTAANRASLDELVGKLPRPWRGGMEATMFSHWIFRYLEPHCEHLAMGHPARMKAIAAGKRKTDKLDARLIADMLRANLFPECYVIAPDLQVLRRQMRFRRSMVQQVVMFKNIVASLLMEAGVEYDRERLHGKKYFRQLIQTDPWIEQERQPLLRFSREQIETLEKMDDRLVKMLDRHPLLANRVQTLQSIKGVGPITALTWALEIADPGRFSSTKKAMSYCGLTSAQRESAGKSKRGPISKQRNKHLQTVLVEAAKVAFMWNPTLREVHQKELEKGGHRNRATLAVARKLVAYLLAADRAFYAAQAGEETPAAA
jgi:transposase